MSEYRPRPDDRLVEPLFDGLEVGSDPDAESQGTHIKTPWFLILVVLPAAIATASGTSSIFGWVLIASLVIFLGIWLKIELF
ncbi:MAG: hypothetical protein CMJ61_03190 [Planctomycetaceae bacterium]|nr:hypothetical protein [Planctomycetaceae bacterium]